MRRLTIESASWVVVWACSILLLLLIFTSPVAADVIEYTDHVARKTIHFPSGMTLTTDSGEVLTIVEGSGVMTMGEVALRWDSDAYDDLIIGQAYGNYENEPKVWEKKFAQTSAGLGSVTEWFQERFYYDCDSTPLAGCQVFFGIPASGRTIDLMVSGNLSAVNGAYTGQLSAVEGFVMSAIDDLPTCTSGLAGRMRRDIKNTVSGDQDVLCWCDGEDLIWRPISGNGVCESDGVSGTLRAIMCAATGASSFGAGTMYMKQDGQVFTATIGWNMPRAGSIIGLSWQDTSSGNASDNQVYEARIDDTIVYSDTFTTPSGSARREGAATSQAVGVDTFAQHDQLTLSVTNTANTTSADTMMCVELAFDD